MATSTGEMSRGTIRPVFMDVSNLSVTLAESSAESFYDWHEDFVIKGNHGRDKERSGTLYLLAPNLTQIFFRFSLKHLGIYKVMPERVDGNNETIRRVRAEMYCEEVEFGYSDGVIR